MATTRKFAHKVNKYSTPTVRCIGIGRPSMYSGVDQYVYILSSKENKDSKTKPVMIVINC